MSDKASANSEYSSNFKEFLNRLEREKNRPMGEKLSNLVEKNDLVAMMDYFLLDEEPDNDKNAKKTLLEKIASLKPGEAYRLDKTTTGLPRTMNVLCGDDGEFKLIVETKSKLATGGKQKLPEIGGATKNGKPAWRVDSGEVEYFNLVARVNNDSDVLELQKEVGLSKQMAGDEVQENVLGTEYSNNGEDKISVYSVKAEGSLSEILTPEAVKKLTEQQQNILIMDLLKGVKTFHDQGFAHQDLKPDNLLIYGNQSKGYHLKLTDFGLTSKENSDEEALATVGYHSPEIAYFYSEESSTQHNYYKPRANQVTLADHMIAAHQDSFPPKGDPARYVIRTALRKPNLANDMWAIGIIAFEIRYGRKPNKNDQALIQQDPMLAGLLNCDRGQRFNIDKALEIHQERVKEHEQSLLPPSTKTESPQPQALKPTGEQDKPTNQAKLKAPTSIPGSSSAVEPWMHQMVGSTELINRLAKKETGTDDSFHADSSNTPLNKILSKTRDELENDYKKLRQPGSSAMGNWMLNRHKDLGTYVFGKGKIRKEQLNLLSNVITHLKSSTENIDANENKKAKSLYAVLSKIERDIGKEYNTHQSGMNKLVQKLKSDLETEFPDLKKQTPEEIETAENHILSKVNPGGKNNKKLKR